MLKPVSRENIYYVFHLLWVVLFIFTLIFTEARYAYLLVREGFSGNIIGAILGFFIGFTINAAQVGLVFSIIRIVVNMIKPKD